ncbi:hypothetical protein MGN70_012803 [Eutypa lata]|uniref:Uncharacterized protein n=1 Tax=Eutypa lata (strain UCR-EL1) TaxID=1287681 RepID=M7T4K3_EUTLA|nr:hypothetical protein UCREL1_8294 [Eutypa lata UCREL1]KAI1245909.1 hypothetical protein MGN70_012803 [Eutypa lata]
MQFTTIIAAVSALAASAHAAAIQRDGARLAQFRIFGAAGCDELNQGFFTVDRSDVDTCHSLVDTVPETGIVSLNLEGWQEAAAGCTLSIFTDAGCSAGARAVSLNVCNDPAQEGETWNSWQITCPA